MTRAREAEPVSSARRGCETGPEYVRTLGRSSCGVPALPLRTLCALIASLWLAEEQFACGLLERCRELPVGEAGFVEFAEGLVAREHEEEVECAGGCAVA